MFVRRKKCIFANDMTIEEIKRIVDGERAEQLTALLCRHWEVAARRLEALAQEVELGMDTCIEAEIYAALMRMQSAVMVLMELNKIPTVYLFSEYLDCIAQAVSDNSVRQSVMTLFERLQGEQPSSPNEGRVEGTSFFDLVIRTMEQIMASPQEQQEDIRQQEAVSNYFFSVCAQHTNPQDSLMIANIIQNINSEDPAKNQERVVSHLQNMRQAMDELNSKMGESLQMMLMWLLLLMLLPGMMVSMMQRRRADSYGMAQLFNKVLMQVRESVEWWNYWKVQRETLRVVSDNKSWKDIMTAERAKERAKLGQVPGGLFAKYTTSPEAFEAEFLETGLSDDVLRQFIFHLATLYEITRELNPTAKFGNEQLVKNDQQRVDEAVMVAAQRLHDLVAEAWFPHYDAMWQELISDETIFAHLKVTRRSQHNNLFTARFFCHLVGEMKKSAVFGAHSDNDLAEKLTDKRYVGTFRKNIQEGMGEEHEDVQNSFNAIYQKYRKLAHPKG